LFCSHCAFGELRAVRASSLFGSVLFVLSHGVIGGTDLLERLSRTSRLYPPGYPLFLG
jgi:hypothetical protein